MRRSLKVSQFFGFIFLGGIFGSFSQAAFHSANKYEIVASAQIVGAATLNITADTLPPQAFFGKNVVIPVTVSNGGAPLDTRNLRVEIVYQLVDSSSKSITGLATAPVLLTADAAHANTLHGAAIIARDEISAIRHGGHLQYFFRARQSTGDTVLQRSGIFYRAPAAGNAAADAPFDVAMIDSLTADVGPAGTQVSVPDTYFSDGQTTVAFDPGALSAPGKLIIREEDPEGYQTGPKGLKPTVVYSLNLQGTKLQKLAHLTLSYPADIDGKITGTRATPTDLAPFYLDALGWTLLSRPQIDTRRHTVLATTTHFSTFALFASGPIAAKDERTHSRIITPNGDGINDTAKFSNADGEDIHFFDIRGRRIRTVPGPNSIWDGKDDDGKTVESGVYIYQYTSQGDRVSGVIYVAK